MVVWEHELGSLTDNKDQPRHPELGGKLELQLRIGQFGPVPNRAPVAEPDDANIYISVSDLAAAVVSGFGNRAR